MAIGRNYQRLIPFLIPHSSTFAIALGCTLGFVLTMPLLAQMVKWMSESIGRGDLRAISQLAAIALVVFVVRGMFQYGQDSLMARASLQVVLELRQQVYRHLHTLDLDYFAGARTGDLTYRMTEDLDRLGEVVLKFFHQSIPSVLTILSVLAYMLYLNLTLTVTTLVVAPLMGVLIGWFGDRMLANARLSQDSVSDLSSLLTEVFSGIRLIRAFAAEEYELKRFSAIAEVNRETRFQTEHVKAVQYPVVGFLYALSVLLVFWLGGWQISRGELTGSEFIGFLTGVALLIDPIVLITANFSELKQGQASVDRVFELLDLQASVVDRPGAKMLPPIQGGVEFRQVTFGYQAEQPVLKSFNLSAEPGQTIALVGSSGAGKTTLVNLIPRFYDPQEGQILVDGIDIASVTLDSLRRQIGIVPQETILFSGTIAQNIAYGREDIPQEEIELAARKANAHEFIERLGDGYATLVGERGVNLSGGQRQRLAIARALLLKPKLLILDEATSALDNESEALVQEALNRLMQQCTVFVIAHRLSTVREADCIVVLEEGRVVESGKHDALLARGGRYAYFHDRQFV